MPNNAKIVVGKLVFVQKSTFRIYLGEDCELMKIRFGEFVFTNAPSCLEKYS